MSIFAKSFVAAAVLAQSATAFPAYAMRGLSLDAPTPKRDLIARDDFPTNLTERLGTYMAPGPNDARGPCPALNTIANHGIINHNGSDLNSNDVLNGLSRGFGINTDALTTAINNFHIVCQYVTGESCTDPIDNTTFILKNLTVLGEPHAFEHDHSFSRQDYHESWAGEGVSNNMLFNDTIFKTSLAVVNYTATNPPAPALADYVDFNEIRLQRESIQNTNDAMGWFQQNLPVMLFEAGFIFGVTFNRDSSGNMIGDEPMVRLDWWNFWFSEESFPTKLGWVPASTAVFNNDFVLSQSSMILNAEVTSTPTNLPAAALATTYAPPATLPVSDPSPTYLLAAGTPYVAPTAPEDIAAETATLNQKRQATVSAAGSVITAAPSMIESAMSLVGPKPSKYHFYQDNVDMNMLENQIASAQNYEYAVSSAVMSMAAAK